ncbi:hypothetical protein AB0E25_30515 [Streptomyces bobili]|uniref:hypothetical protein n=1 Tax=Streptomyces bobili TaxID=67280 RepID=UPI0034040713
MGVGIHWKLGDVDGALAYTVDLVPAALPAPERRTRAATDTARALVAVGDVPATSVQLQRVERTAPLTSRTLAPAELRPQASPTSPRSRQHHTDGGRKTRENARLTGRQPLKERFVLAGVFGIAGLLEESATAVGGCLVR